MPSYDAMALDQMDSGSPETEPTHGAFEGEHGGRICDHLVTPRRNHERILRDGSECGNGAQRADRRKLHHLEPRGETRGREHVPLPEPLRDDGHRESNGVTGIGSP